MKIKRILLGLGGTEYTPVAIRHAVELSRLHGAEVTGVTVTDESRIASSGPVPMGGAHVARALGEKRLATSRERVDKAIDQFEMACAAQSIPFKLHQECGEPFSQMTSLSRYHDLMVFGLRSLFDSGLGVDPEDTLTRLVRTGVRPMLAVPSEYHPIRKALLAYSGSPESAKAIRRFIQSRLWPDTELKLLACGQSREHGEQLAADMSGYCRAHGLEPEIEVSLSNPNQQILESAGAYDADLIVMGNGVRSLWLDRILGSTALHVVRHSTRALYLAQ